jgi:hypothetical protein
MITLLRAQSDDLRYLELIVAQPVNGIKTRFLADFQPWTADTSYYHRPLSDFARQASHREAPELV